MSPIDELYVHSEQDGVLDEANRVVIASASAVSSLVAACWTYEKAAKKADAYFKMQRIQQEQSTKVLPLTTHDVDMGKNHSEELKRYKKIYESVEWKDILVPAACALYCGLLSVTLL